MKMSMNKNLVIALVVIAVLVVGGYVLWGKQSHPQNATLRIGTFSKAIDYAPLYIARNKGWIEDVAKKYGMTVEYTEFQSLPPINEAFATNNIDFVFAAEAPAIVGKAAGIDTKILYPSASITQEVIVQKDSPIQSFKDLKGKKIAVLAGTSANYLLVKTLEKNGLTANDVQIIDMIPPDAKVAFETKQVDAWAIWPPFIEQELVAGYGKTIKADGYTQVVAIARGGFVKDQPELAKEIGATIKQAQQWIIQNGKEAQSTVAQEIDLPLEVVELSWPKVNFSYSIGQAEIKDAQEKADFLQSIGLIKRKVNVEQELFVK